MNDGQRLTAGAAGGGILLGIFGIVTGAIIPGIVVGGASMAVKSVVEDNPAGPGK